METSQKDGGNKMALDDSGVQDVDKQPEPDKTAELLDLSDDVLLCILKYCAPMDLKALGFTCPRLGRLIRDRTLWTRVDARGQRTGRLRMRWLLAHALGPNTVELKLQGYANDARGCLGHVNRSRKEVEEEKDFIRQRQQESAAPSCPGRSQDPPAMTQDVDTLERLHKVYAQNRSRMGCAVYPDETSTGVNPEDLVLLDGSCPGPQFTLTKCMMRQLRLHCSLTSLALEYCNINCNTTGISHFPPTLKKLSLKGSKCYNLPLDKSYLFNIQDYLPEIEDLDLSECDWLEPASLLPLSKASRLVRLVMRDCYRMSEFVAYASLATRYGFRKLEYLDVRGSPIADSEVSAFGWLPALREVYVSPARRAPPPHRDHAHYKDEELPPHKELELWEMEVPEYFKIRPSVVEPTKPRAGMTAEELERVTQYENSLCLHGLEYNLCTDGGLFGPSPRKRAADGSWVSEGTDFLDNPLASASTDPGHPKVIEVSLRGREGVRTSHSVRILPSPQRFNMRDQFDETEAKRRKIKDTPTVARDVATDTDTEEVTASPTYTVPEIPGCSYFSKHSEATETENKYLVEPQDESTNTQKNNETETPKTFQDKPGPSTQIQCSNKSQDVATMTVEPEPLNLHKNINEGASCSRAPDYGPTDDERTEHGPRNSVCYDPDGHCYNCHCRNESNFEYIRFRKDMQPVVVRRGHPDPELERDERPRQREREQQNAGENREVRPRAHVLYVNVGQQLHTVYRLSMHNEPPIFYSFAGNSHLRFRPNVGNMFYSHPNLHLDPTNLVSDIAVRRFGRADVEDINVVHIGPRIGAGDPAARPNRSSLRVLSFTGFRNITDRSLVHLVTAAPDLRLVDFTETRVTAQGVANFRSLRPDCKVIFSEFVEKDE